MTSVLFTNVRIFDGTGNRISRIARGARQRMPTEEHILGCAPVAK